MATKHTNIFGALRFVMIFYIVQGHFIQVAISDPKWLALFKQHNTVVGCFFLLSGFLLTFGRSALSGAVQFWPFFKRRLARVYPVYFVVLALFAPMFLAVDFHYGATWSLEVKRALLVTLLLQAWHPDYGLLWNSPAWFLSSLVFCYACFPSIVTRAQGLSSRKIIAWGALVFCLLVMIKFWYTSKTSIFLLEGMQTTVPHFDLVRFFPPINLLEFTLGALTGIVYSRAQHHANWATRYLPAGLLAVLVLIMIGRIYFPLNDMLTRTFLFTPIFLLFLYLVSANHAKFLDVFEAKLWVFLGDISFCLYCVHGALGQLFYKKAVKAMLAMPDVPYSFYLLLLFVISAMLHYGVEMRVAGLSRWLVHGARKSESPKPIV